MPIDARVLGFSNRWYPAAIETAQVWQIAGHDVRVVTAALFIATKLEAFRGRGRGDVFASHDLEDIVAVVDGRPGIVAEVGGADSEVRLYIASAVRSLLADPDFVDALPAFLLPDVASQARRAIVEERLGALSDLADR
jgi:hypothetical protein